MLDSHTRLRVILASYQLRFPGESELQLLRRIDARIVPLLSDTIEILPTTKATLEGFVSLVEALDDRLENLGHPEFKQHPRLTGAKGFFAADTTTVEAATPHLDAYAQIRVDLWKQIPSQP